MGPRNNRRAPLPGLGLRLDRDAEEPLFRQIASQLRASIESGRLPRGARLPAERLLARALDVNRATVLAAYNELKREGLVAGHVGRGTEVVGTPVAAPVPWSDVMRPTGPADPLIRDLLGADDPDVVSLALGLPGPDLIPVQELADLHARAFAEAGPRAFMHTPTEGLPVLREALAERLAARGIRVSPSEVLVTSGSQQALELVSRGLIAPGDLVVVEEPTYVGMLQALRAAGARTVTVPVDGDGMQVERLEPLLARLRPRLIYTQPTYQNPTGAVMSLPRRKRLLELAARYQVPIVEDDPYTELRYDDVAPPPSLKALDERGIVFHVGTASKTLCPGFRLGWLAGPAPVVRQLALAKQAADLHPATPGQWALAEFLKSGALDRHLERIRPEYRRRRDALLEALRGTESFGVRWVEPAGGIFVWGRVPATTSMARLLAEAARERVAFLPGSVFSAEGASAHGLRLNFSALPVDRLREGARRLSRALGHAARAGISPLSGLDTGLRPIV